MSKLPLAALVSGLALSLATLVALPALAAPAGGDDPARAPSPKKEREIKADTRSEKAKGGGPKDADQPTSSPSPKKEKVAKPDTRSDKAKAATFPKKGTD